MKWILLQISSLALLVVALVSGVKLRGYVDESKPDLSMFKLKRVRADELESVRNGTAPIRNLDTGAILMREHLFSSNQVARCSAYAHLLRLITSHQDEESDQRVNLEVVESLAIVSDVDVEEYAQLMEFDQQSMAQLFKKAIEELERRRSQTSASRDAWLELADCARDQQLGLDKFLNEFLAKAHRKAQAQEFRKLSTEPVDSRHRVFTPARIESARATIEQLDDEELSKLRASIRNEKTKAPDALELPIATTNITDEEQIAQHITLMTSVKQRLALLLAAEAQHVPMDKKAKLAMRSAYDYVHSWQELDKFVVSSQSASSSLALKGREFLEDAENKKVAGRMQQIVDNNEQVNEIIDELKKFFPVKTTEERVQLNERLRELLAATDPMLDLLDQRRQALKITDLELKMLKTVNRVSSWFDG